MSSSVQASERVERLLPSDGIVDRSAPSEGDATQDPPPDPERAERGPTTPPSGRQSEAGSGSSRPSTGSSLNSAFVYRPHVERERARAVPVRRQSRLVPIVRILGELLAERTMGVFLITVILLNLGIAAWAIQVTVTRKHCRAPLVEWVLLTGLLWFLHVLTLTYEAWERRYYGTRMRRCPLSRVTVLLIIIWGGTGFVFEYQLPPLPEGKMSAEEKVIAEAKASEACSKEIRILSKLVLEGQTRVFLLFLLAELIVRLVFASAQLLTAGNGRWYTHRASSTDDGTAGGAERLVVQPLWEGTFGELKREIESAQGEEAGRDMVTSCPICFENFEEDSLVARAPCAVSHFFCLWCIERWLRVSPQCPVCRADLREAPSSSSEPGTSPFSSSSQLEGEGEGEGGERQGEGGREEGGGEALPVQAEGEEVERQLPSSSASVGMGAGGRSSVPTGNSNEGLLPTAAGQSGGVGGNTGPGPDSPFCGTSMDSKRNPRQLGGQPGEGEERPSSQEEEGEAPQCSKCDHASVPPNAETRASGAEGQSATSTTSPLHPRIVNPPHLSTSFAPPPTDQGSTVTTSQGGSHEVQDPEQHLRRPLFDESEEP